MKWEGKAIFRSLAIEPHFRIFNLVTADEIHESKTEVSAIKSMLKEVNACATSDFDFSFTRHEVGFQENTQKWEINGGGTNETLRT